MCRKQYPTLKLKVDRDLQEQIKESSNEKEYAKQLAALKRQNRLFVEMFSIKIEYGNRWVKL